MNTMRTNEPINLRNLIPSEHLIEHRMDRYMEIQMKIGFGNKFVVVVEMDTKYECLTDTGVVMVISKDTYDGKRLLITTYVGTIDKANAMFRSSGYPKLPSFVSTAILKANKKRMEK